jgi:hypothetical protein
MQLRRLTAVAAAATLALGVTACGDEDTDNGADTADTADTGAEDGAGDDMGDDDMAEDDAAGDEAAGDADDPSDPSEP